MHLKNYCIDIGLFSIWQACTLDWTGLRCLLVITFVGTQLTQNRSLIFSPKTASLKKVQPISTNLEHSGSCVPIWFRLSFSLFIFFSAVILTRPLFHFPIQWGSENWTCPDFEWLTWPFEIQTFLVQTVLYIAKTMFIYEGVQACNIWLQFWIFAIQNLDHENAMILNVSGFQITTLEDN